jgi:hypothetical protein
MKDMVHIAKKEVRFEVLKKVTSCQVGWNIITIETFI